MKHLTSCREPGVPVTRDFRVAGWEPDHAASGT